MAKKYIYADSAYSLTNPPKGVTVLEFDTETNTIGIYNNKKAAAAIPVQPETDGDDSFTIPVIPTKLSELQNDKQFVVSADLEGKYALKSELQSFLSDISYNSEDKVLSFTFKLSDGSQTSQDISISDLVDTYEAGNNIKIEGNVISFTGDIPNTADYITVKAVEDMISGVALKSELPDTSDFITINDIKDTYALKSQIPSVSAFITAQDLPEIPEQPTKLSELQNDQEFITLQDIPESVNAEFVKSALQSYAKSYTAFQVMPNKVAITDYAVEVPACTEHKFTLRSAVDVQDNDVIIDWGDGTIEAIKDGKYTWKSGKQYDLSHDYASSMTEDVQTFIVKIYGKDYYTFRNNSFPNNNLISRIFDVDLPIASHIGNFASMCFGATRLINVAIPHSTKYVTTGFNFSSTFESATNLVSVTGFEDSPLRYDCLVSNIFNKCKSLTTTDFAIPVCALSIAGIFAGCPSLTTATRLVPACGVLGAGKINISNAWLNVPAAVKATVPQSLGGTLTE